MNKLPISHLGPPLYIPTNISSLYISTYIVNLINILYVHNIKIIHDVHEIYTIKYSHIYIFNLTFILFCD